MRYWRVTPEWRGEVIFIIGGGTSVKSLDLAPLVGRKVIAINSSYETWPAADILFFGDKRWWVEHRKRQAFTVFKGRKVTVSTFFDQDDTVLRLHRVVPAERAGVLGPGYASECNRVVSNRTALQGAMNLAGHLLGGPGHLVLLGADMGRGADGKTHHHAPHRWKNRPGNQTWDVQMTQLALMVDPLKERGIQVLNVSPISRLPWWPKFPTLESALCHLAKSTNPVSLTNSTGPGSMTRQRSIASSGHLANIRRRMSNDSPASLYQID